MAIEVKQVEGNEVAAEVLATAITKISDGLAQWGKSGMRKRALIVLLADSTRVCKRDIERVIDGIGMLTNVYCLPKPAPTSKK